jgi:superfamily II DNA or RNA helicase
MVATDPRDLELIAPGSRVVIRDQDWQVVDIEMDGLGGRAVVRCIGRSELVRDQAASFFSDLDKIEPEDPTRTFFRLDLSANGIETQLVLDSLVRRTPIPVSNRALTVGQLNLADEMPFQREPFRKSTNQLQPRLLIADAVGLGKTIEVGTILSELQRRGRADRVLAVVPRHILDQIQHELWCRFSFPLVRLDSEGIQKVRQRIPAGRNPFTFFNRVIVSIDTLKNPSRYRHHLERVRWDVVWFDESHKLVNPGTRNNELAKRLAPNADALILTSATPHNGKPESFAELIALLDPTAVPDPDQVRSEDIEHLIVRRHRHSPDVEAAIADHWAERKPPIPLTVKPSAEEEAIFYELSSTWLSPDGPSPSSDSLFAYTLLKASLSSPDALLESVEKRMIRGQANRTSDQGTPPSREESEALQRLHVLADEAVQGHSAKMAALVEQLREIGVGPRSATRVVIFSERIRTLNWIAESVRTTLKMTEDQVVTFHNSKPDDEQQRIVESFSMASAPIRVLVTSDIASEGVNLHKQCHQLIHFDLPWSLITLEQRNGRIDRYGQATSPEVRYLIYNPTDSEIASDVKILSKLVEKEDAAHRALGDAGSIMGLYSESAEEQAIIEALRKHDLEAKEEAFEQKAPVVPKFDPWSLIDKPTAAADIVKTEPIPSLFDDRGEYFRKGLEYIFGNLREINWETDGQVLSFTPPDDLLTRLSVLPQSYLRQRNIAGRLRLTTDPDVANRSLNLALNSMANDGSTGTAWPEVHYLGPQHPVMTWLADKLLYRLERNEAIAIGCDVDTPTWLVSGVWSNRAGEPIATTWVAATVDDGIVTFGELFDELKRAGVSAGMVNAGSDVNLASLERQLPEVVLAVTAKLATHMEDELDEVKIRLADLKVRLGWWQLQARSNAEKIPDATRRNARMTEIERTTQQLSALVADHTPAGAPLIRIIGALVPITKI